MSNVFIFWASTGTLTTLHSENGKEVLHVLIDVHPAFCGSSGHWHSCLFSHHNKHNQTQNNEIQFKSWVLRLSGFRQKKCGGIILTIHWNCKKKIASEWKTVKRNSSNNSFVCSNVNKSCQFRSMLAYAAKCCNLSQWVLLHGICWSRSLISFNILQRNYSSGMQRTIKIFHNQAINRREE